MNQDSLESIWASLDRRESLPPGSLAELETQLRNDKGLLNRVADERIVDAVLNLESRSELQHDQFVTKCVSRIIAQASSTDEFSTPIGTRSRIETVSPAGVPYARPVEQATTDSSEFDSEMPSIVELNDCGRRGIRARTAPRQHDQFWSRRNVSMLVTATAAVLLLSLVIVFSESSDSPKTTTHRTGNLQSERADSSEETSPQTAVQTPAPGHGTDLSQEAEVNEALSVDTSSNSRIRNPVHPPLLINESLADSGPASKSGLAQTPTRSELLSANPTQPFAEWAHRDSDNPKDQAKTRIGLQEVDVERGRGQIAFDNGTKIYYEAPFKSTFLSDRKMKISWGTVSLEVPTRAKGFELETPNQRLVVSGRADFQVLCKEAGDLECYVSRGRVKMQPASENSELNAVELSSRGANQFLANAPENNSIPTVSVLRGRQQFLGQIGVGNQTVQTESPAELQQMADGLRQCQKELGTEGMLIKWQGFADRVKKLQQARSVPPEAMRQLIGGLFPQNAFPTNLRNPGDGRQNSSTNFQGSLNVNGQEQKFNSIEDFERARRMLTNGGLLPDKFGQVPNPVGQNANSNSAFQGEININGRPFKFTSPEEFRMFQRRMRR